MIKESIICPACGSVDIMRHEKKSKGLLTLGPEFYFKEIEYNTYDNICPSIKDYVYEKPENFSIVTLGQMHHVLEKGWTGWWSNYLINSNAAWRASILVCAFLNFILNSSFVEFLILSNSNKDNFNANKWSALSSSNIDFTNKGKTSVVTLSNLPIKPSLLAISITCFSNNSLASLFFL